MRGALVIAVMLALAAPAEAKYDPCRSDGAMWLAPSGPMARNARLWLIGFDGNNSVSYRVRGTGVDRIVRLQRAHRDGSPGFLDLGWLAPAATYEVTIVEWELLIARFTTSTGEDAVPPAAPVIRSLAIAHPTDDDHAPRDDDPPLVAAAFGDAGDDLPANDVAIAIDLSDDTVFLDVTVRDETSANHVVLWRGDLRLLGRTRCGPQFHLAAGAHACVSIRAIDRAGNIGAPATRCTSVIDRPGDSRRPIVPLLRFPPPASEAPSRPRAWSMVAGLILALALVTSRLVLLEQRQRADAE